MNSNTVTNISSDEGFTLPSDKKSSYEGIIAYFLVLIGAITYISLTFNNNVWLDEAFTASLVNTDMAGVLSRSMADTLPPLYNIILKLSTDIFGYSVPVMKITSTIPMILTMLLGATVVRKRFGALTSYLFILAIIVMPNMMFYGVEIRMYSLGFFFATASGIMAYEMICRHDLKNCASFVIVSVLAGYSHHFAFVAVGFIYLFLLIYSIVEQHRLRHDKAKPSHQFILTNWFKCLAATIILYFPCLIVTLKQLKSVSGYFSMPDVTLKVFVKYCRYPYTVGLTVLSIALLILVAFLFIRLLIRDPKTKKDYFAIWCFILYYGVLIFGTIVSKIMTANIFVDRYLFFSLGMIWLFFSIEAGSLKKPFIYAILVFEIVMGIYSYTVAYSSEYAKGADKVISWLNNNVNDGDALYTLEDYEELAYCLTFYDNRLVNYESLSDALDAIDNNTETNTVWVPVLGNYASEDPSENSEGNLGYNAYVDEIEKKGYRLEYIDSFTFDRYKFDMYKLKRNI